MFVIFPMLMARKRDACEEGRNDTMIFALGLLVQQAGWNEIRNSFFMFKMQVASFAIVVNQLKNLYDEFFVSSCERCRGTGCLTCPHVRLTILVVL